MNIHICIQPNLRANIHQYFSKQAVDCLSSYIYSVPLLLWISLFGFASRKDTSRMVRSLPRFDYNWKKKQPKSQKIIYYKELITVNNTSQHLQSNIFVWLTQCRRFYLTDCLRLWTLCYGSAGYFINEIWAAMTLLSYDACGWLAVADIQRLN